MTRKRSSVDRGPGVRLQPRLTSSRVVVERSVGELHTVTPSDDLHHLRLPAPVVHPLLLRTALHVLARHLGIRPGQVQALAQCALHVVTEPFPGAPRLRKRAGVATLTGVDAIRWLTARGRSLPAHLGDAWSLDVLPVRPALLLRVPGLRERWEDVVRAVLMLKHAARGAETIARRSVLQLAVNAYFLALERALRRRWNPTLKLPFDEEPTTRPPPIAAVAGLLHLTAARGKARGSGSAFASVEELLAALEARALDLQAVIPFRCEGARVTTTPGRVLLHTLINGVSFSQVNRPLVPEATAELLESVSPSVREALIRVGAAWAGAAAISVGKELCPPQEHSAVVARAAERTRDLHDRHDRGEITQGERDTSTHTAWEEACADLEPSIQRERARHLVLQVGASCVPST
ncbi:MAG: hypothetical protein AB2A00_40465 [Myxococcota bacterium]